MKKTLLIAVSLLLLVAFVPKVNAQEEESPWSTGLDIYSSYIWRGAKFGSGPAFQPYVSFATGGFEIGAWGSISASTDEALEMDLYASYGFGPVTLTVTDYYFGGDWTQYSNTHYLEPSIGLGFGDFSVMGAFMFLAGSDAVAGVDAMPAKVDLTTGIITPAVEGVDAMEETSFGSSMDMYFEAGYSFGSVDVALGAGNGQYTSDGEFNVCNITVGTSKEVPITESFSLPVSGAVILNPSTGGFFITVGISL